MPEIGADDGPHRKRRAHARPSGRWTNSAKGSGAAGISISTAAVLAGILPAYATAAVPGGLAATAANAALATLGTSGIAALVTSMNATKITLATVGVLGVIGFAGFEAHRASTRQDELGGLRQEVYPQCGATPHVGKTDK